jgi:hypothetical protein
MSTNNLIRIARESGYQVQKEWLKDHGFEFCESYAQWVVIAEMVKNQNGAKRDFDRACGMHAGARGNTARNTAFHKLLDSRLRKEIITSNPTLAEHEIESEILKLRGNDKIRKSHLKEMRKMSQKIFYTYKTSGQE